MKLVYRSIFLCVVVSVCWVKATNIRFEIISSGVEVAQSFHGHDQEQAPDRADPAKRRRGVSRSTTRRHLRVVADGLGAGAGAGAGFDENSTALLLPSGTKITFDSL